MSRWFQQTYTHQASHYAKQSYAQIKVRFSTAVCYCVGSRCVIYKLPVDFVSLYPPLCDWISFLACSRIFLMASSDPVSGVRMRGVMLPAGEGKGERGGEVSGPVDQRAAPKPCVWLLDQWPPLRTGIKWGCGNTWKLYFQNWEGKQSCESITTNTGFGRECGSCAQIQW